MAKIRRSGKSLTIKFDNKAESSRFLRAAGFKNIPALQEAGQPNTGLQADGAEEAGQPNTGLQADGAEEPEHTGIPETCKHPDCVRLFQSPAAKA